jgi:hypothetical protein
MAVSIFRLFQVNFEHGQVDHDSFATFEAGLKYEFPEVRPNKKEASEEPKLKVSIKTDQLTYSNMTRSISGIEKSFNVYITLFISFYSKNCVPLQHLPKRAPETGSK